MKNLLPYALFMFLVVSMAALHEMAEKPMITMGTTARSNVLIGDDPRLRDTTGIPFEMTTEDYQRTEDHQRDAKYFYEAGIKDGIREVALKYCDKPPGWHVVFKRENGEEIKVECP